MSEKKEILKEIFYFSGSKYLNQFVQLFSSLLVARMLGPQLKGVWAALSLIVIYSVYLQFGTLMAMVRQVPLFRSQQRLEKVARIQNSVFAFNFFAALFFAILLFGISFFIGRGERGSLYATGLRFMAAIVFLNHMNRFVVDFLRAEKRFVELSKFNVLFEFSGSVLAVVLVYFFELNGMYLAKIAAGVLAGAFVFHKVFRRVRVRIHWEEIWELLPIGIPLLIIAFAFLLFFTVDRFMILKFMNETELGYYSIAILLVNTILFVPYSISNVFYPRIVEEFGRSGISPSLWRYIRKPGEMVSKGVALMIGFFLIAAPWGIHRLLPAFFPGVKASLFLMVGIFFYSISLVPANLLVTVKRLKSYLAIVVVSLLLSALLDYLFIQWGWGLWGIGLGTSISYWVFSIIVLIYVSGFFLDKIVDRLLFLGKLYSPLLYLFLAGSASFAASKALQLDFGDLTATAPALVKFAFFSIFSLPLIGVLLEKSGFSFRSLFQPPRGRRTEVSHDSGKSSDH